MSNPFNFNFNLPHHVKLIVIVLSIFLVSLSVGMLVFGSTAPVDDSLSAEVLHHSSEEIMHITP